MISQFLYVRQESTRCENRRFDIMGSMVRISVLKQWPQYQRNLCTYLKTYQSSVRTVRYNDQQEIDDSSLLKR